MQTRTRGDGAVEVTAPKSKSKSKGASLRDVTLEPTDNGGMIVRCGYRSTGEGKSSMLAYHEPSVKAYGSAGDALKAVAALFSTTAKPDEHEDED